MKKIFTFIGTLLITGAVSSQVYLNEDFTGGTLPVGWANEDSTATATGQVWEFNNPGSRNITGQAFDADFAILDSDNYGSGGDQDAHLKTSSFSTMGSSNVILEFDEQFRAYGSSNASVDVSNDGGATWTNYQITTANLGYPNPSVHTILDISATAANQANVIIRFKYVGSWGYWWAVDNINVFQPVNNDLGIIAASAPTSNCGLTATETVTVDIKNYGLMSQSSFPVTFVLNNGTPVTETVAGPILPGDTLTYTFTATADLSAVMIHSLDFYSGLTGDQNNMNDTLLGYTAEHFNNVLPFNEDFDLNADGTFGMFAHGWTSSNTTGFRWQAETAATGSSSTGPSGPSSGTGAYVYTEASNGSAGDTTDLVSTCIDLGSATSPVLEFLYHKYGSVMGNLYIDIYSGGTWTTVDSIIGETQTSDTDPWLSKQVNLSAFSGVINIRFRGVSNGTWQGDMAIDDVTVFQPVNNDLSLLSVETPTSGCGLTSSEVVTVKVVNNGLLQQAGYPVSYTLDAGTPVVETIAGVILPGDTVTYTFTAMADLSSTGMHTIDAYVGLSTDQYTGNDTLLGYTVENLVPSTSASDSLFISNTQANTQSIICTDGLFPGMTLNSTCFILQAVVIDSMTHTFAGDIDMYLISPAGDTLELTTDNGGGNDNFMNVVFTDTALTYPQSATSGFGSGGYFHPEDTVGLATFNGIDPNGAWTLLIFDDAGGDDGVLYDWHLEFVNNNPTVADLGLDTTICYSTSYTLDAGSGANYTYMWSTGATTQTITIDTTMAGINYGANNIVVTVTDSTGACTASDSVVVTFGGCAGVTEVTDNVILNIFPNPSNGLFTLNIQSKDIEEMGVVITDMSGKVVYRKSNFSNVTNVNTTVDLSGNAKGVYIISIVTDKGMINEKIIVK